MGIIKMGMTPKEVIIVAETTAKITTLMNSRHRKFLRNFLKENSKLLPRFLKMFFDSLAQISGSHWQIMAILAVMINRKRMMQSGNAKKPISGSRT